MVLKVAHTLLFCSRSRSHASTQWMGFKFHSISTHSCHMHPSPSRIMGKPSSLSPKHARYGLPIMPLASSGLLFHTRKTYPSNPCQCLLPKKPFQRSQSIYALSSVELVLRPWILWWALLEFNGSLNLYIWPIQWHKKFSKWYLLNTWHTEALD